MKVKILFCCIIIMALMTSCKLKESSDFGTDTGTINSTGGSVTFKGSVYDTQTGLPIKQAVVRIVVDGVNKGSTTDSLGIFNFSTTIATSGEYPFITSKEGYYPDTLATFALIDNTIEIPTRRLVRQSTTIDPSGNAASIVLKSQSVQSIGIKGSGAQEAANLVFEVQDANGKPVDPNHAVTLSFRIGSSPGSAEYLFPLTAKTNSYGLATVTLNSGTKAGVVQVIAETTVSGKLLSSTPVAMAIHGGLPDAAHFFVACDKLNYPFLGIIGNVIQFSAYVGDKYSNPVRPGTTVYFYETTGTGGQIAGSAQTNEMGVATASFLNYALPIHPDPTLGRGYFEITAKTINESNVTISTSTIRLLTGEPGTVAFNTTTFDIPNGQFQEFQFEVTDVLGHPMAPGTSISISTEGGSAKLYGSTNFTMPDAMFSGNGTTVFRFQVADGNPDEDKASALQIKITVNSTRGTFTNFISGIIH